MKNLIETLIVLICTVAPFLSLFAFIITADRSPSVSAVFAVTSVSVICLCIISLVTLIRRTR